MHGTVWCRCCLWWFIVCSPSYFQQNITRLWKLITCWEAYNLHFWDCFLRCKLLGCLVSWTKIQHLTAVGFIVEVLCATATLAMGVNLPAHLVVLKGTRRYCSADENPDHVRGYKEYDKSACLQMIGRAGRPQFDTEGVAVIMTLRQVTCWILNWYVFLCRPGLDLPSVFRHDLLS